MRELTRIVLPASEEDRKITVQIATALRLIDCHVLDHIIISGKNYFSFCDEGLL